MIFISVSTIFVENSLYLWYILTYNLMEMLSVKENLQQNIFSNKKFINFFFASLFFRNFL